MINKHNKDEKFLMIYTIILQILGILLMGKIFYSASLFLFRYNIKKLLFNEIFYNVIGFLIVLYLRKQSKKKITNISCVFTFILIGLLIFLAVAGKKINGSKRWIRLGSFSIQPSAYLLSFYSIINGNLLFHGKKNKSFILFFFLIFLFMTQPDFGSSIVLSSIWGIQNLTYLGFTAIRNKIVAIVSLFLIMLLRKGKYAILRIKNMFQSTNKFDQSFLALRAISHSNFFLPGKILYIPEMHNDYFFSALCNNFGILFTMIYSLLWMGFFLKIINVTSSINDNLKKIKLLGLLIAILVPFFLHVFTNLKLIPSKGTSLPLTSYGGSLFLSHCIIIGLILSVINYKSSTSNEIILQ